ncbi:MAG: outer membrane protein assembly factor BamE [Neisseriaceae bacterium]|nr:outer membrane protein assembly factor BamE [Neisseriaceae bacterium]
MKKMNKTLLGLTTVAALLLSACTSVSHVQSNGTTEEVVWPDAEGVSFKTGSFPVVSALKLVRPSMTKDQLSHLLGRPHFNEGLVGVVEWDYLFHFALPNGEVKTCQYKVLFDQNKLAQSFFWREPECAALVDGQPVPKAVQKERVELSADALFQFNGGSGEELLPKGKAQLEGLVQQINAGYVTVANIELTGHTDRLGSDAYNQRLGLQRAETVKQYLLAQGLNAPIHTQSVGKTRPQSSGCQGQVATAELIGCLQPDRRVTVEIQGVKKQ